MRLALQANVSIACRLIIDMFSSLCLLSFPVPFVAVGAVVSAECSSLMRHS